MMIEKLFRIRGKFSSVCHHQGLSHDYANALFGQLLGGYEIVHVGLGFLGVKRSAVVLDRKTRDAASLAVHPGALAAIDVPLYRLPITIVTMRTLSMLRTLRHTVLLDVSDGVDFLLQLQTAVPTDLHARPRLQHAVKSRGSQLLPLM